LRLGIGKGGKEEGQCAWVSEREVNVTESLGSGGKKSKVIESKVRFWGQEVKTTESEVRPRNKTK